MYIYADESGNTGQYIFNDPEWFYQGAILSLDDIQPIVAPVIDKHTKRLDVERIHANEIPIHEVSAIADELIDVLRDKANFQFHLTAVQKPYLSTTKFVDTVFDSGENKGSRWLWYNSQFFRHSLCLTVNSILTDRNKERFWHALLVADLEGIKESIRNAKIYFSRLKTDRRLRKVILEAFDHALRHGDEFDLSHESKKTRLLHSPNMVGFSSLIDNVHNYAERFSSPPIAFVHDQSDQFNKAMTEMHETRKNAQFKSLDVGGDTKIVEWDLGTLYLASSKSSVELQAVDVLLWILQRRGQQELSGVQNKLSHHLDLYEISSEMSKKVHQMWLHRLNSTRLSQDQIENGQHMVDEMEQRYYQGLYRNINS